LIDSILVVLYIITNSGEDSDNMKGISADNVSSTSIIIDGTSNISTTTESLQSTKAVTASRKRDRECDETTNEDSSMEEESSIYIEKVKTKKRIHDRNWKQMFQRLLIYKDEHKIIVVSKSIDRKLYRWVANQRSNKKHNQLSTERESLLISIGFVWDQGGRKYYEQWSEMYQRLVAYKEEHKTSDVLKSIDTKLYKWMMHQRGNKKKNLLSAKHVSLLESINFVWDAKTYDKQWDAMYQRLITYKDEHNTIVVSKSIDAKLCKWVDNQRNRNGRLSEQRSKLLNDIDFTWVAGNSLFIVI
jgi:hypothetical protein